MMFLCGLKRWKKKRANGMALSVRMSLFTCSCTVCGAPESSHRSSRQSRRKAPWKHSGPTYDIPTSWRSSFMFFKCVICCRSPLWTCWIIAGQIRNVNLCFLQNQSQHNSAFLCIISISLNYCVEMFHVACSGNASAAGLLSPPGSRRSLPSFPQYHDKLYCALLRAFRPDGAMMRPHNAPGNG